MKILRTTQAAAVLLGIAGWASANENASTTDKVMRLDTDMDGQVSLAEYTASGKTPEEFARIDVDGDGLVTAAGMEVGEDRGPVSGEKKDARQGQAADHDRSAIGADRQGQVTCHRSATTPISTPAVGLGTKAVA